MGVGPSGLSSVVTVADLAGAFGGATTAPAPAARPGAAAAEPALEATAAAAAVPAGDEVLAEVIAVVAERTGFPVAVVAPTMALEADLGVDSIKRVELVSAVEQRLGVGPSGLSSVVTVADLAGAFGGTVAARTGELPPEPEPEVCDGQPSPLARLGWIAELADAPGVPLPGLEAVPVCVLADADDDASALVRRLAGAGIQVTDAPAPGGVLVMLGRATEGSAAEDVARVQHCVTRVQEALAAPVARLVLVDVLPPESGLADQPGGGVLAALGRCLALEEPEVEVLTWEVAGLTAADEVAAQVARELVVGAGTDCIRLAPGGRELTALRGLPADRWERVLNPHSVVVVSGGGRGITARIAQAMAGEYHCRFVLLGRTELVDEPAATSRMTGIGEVSAALARTGDPAPLTTARHLFAAREIRDCLSVIEASGGQARYFAVDVTDTDAVAAALAGVRADWGPVSAVVHGAGVLADNLVRTKDTATVDPVIRTKVGGLDALLAATRGDDLSLVVGFSSTSTARGNQGQSDYAIANALLEQRLNRVKTERPAALVRAVAWGPWAAGMVTLALAQRFTEKGIGLIDPDEGAAAMLRETWTPGPVRTVIESLGDGTETLDEVPGRALFEDHAVADRPVLPIAAAAALLLRRAPGGALENLRVVRPLEVAAGTSIVISAEGSELSLRSAGQVHFTAQRTLLQRPSDPPRPGAVTPRSPGYGAGSLFHGPAFRLLGDQVGVGEQSAVGEVRLPADLGWPRDSSPCDVAMLDAGLQLALLWAEQAMNRATLPMGINRLDCYRRGPWPGGSKAIVQADRVGAALSSVDIWYLAPDGGCLARLRGVELVARPAHVLQSA